MLSLLKFKSKISSLIKFLLTFMVVKKIFSILLLIVYSCSFVCVGYNFHFCSGHLKAISFAAPVKDGCSSDGKMPDGCCKDVFLKCKSGDQSIAKVTVLSSVKIDFPFPLILSESLHIFYPAPFVLNHYFLGEQPDKPIACLYLRNRRLLI